MLPAEAAAKRSGRQAQWNFRFGISFPAASVCICPHCAENELWPKRLSVWLQGQQGVKGARLNYACACLIIEYDPSFEGLLRATLGQLSVMSIGELKVLVSAGKQAAAAVHPPAAMRPAEAGLDLAQHAARAADFSLLMAFSANPALGRSTCR